MPMTASLSGLDRIVRDWPAYVGTAVEPFVRDSIERLLPDPKLAGAARVGGYWTRTNDPRSTWEGRTMPRAR